MSLHRDGQSRCKSSFRDFGANIVARQRLRVEERNVPTGCGTPLRGGVAALDSDLPCTGNQRSALRYVDKVSGQAATGGENRVAGHGGSLRDASSNRTYQYLKRGLDCFVSLAALLCFAPLLGAIAVAIKLTSSGPVLFRQQRFGEDLRPFTFYKFRSMHANCDDTIHKAYVTRLIAGCLDVPSETVEERTVLKITRDPRVTSLGKFLRRTSLDELPQLWNVLRGDMSLVGPRPCLSYELEQYSARHTLRLIGVKPGITGLWQVSGRSTLSFDEMVKLDLVYVKESSFWLDVKILLRTPLAVISGLGAC
jgi:lipopolysaccharide/colanic/teichoic acid biosynthesis glycosyltransferase